MGRDRVVPHPSGLSLDQRPIDELPVRPKCFTVIDKERELNEELVRVVREIGAPSTTITTTSTQPAGPFYQTHIDGLGEIIGHFDQSQDVLTFDNVPFAAPPIGERRFQRPVKFDYPWAGVYNATGPVSWCLQAFAELDVDTDASDKEDCLHLSVYVPRSAFESGSSQQLPVYLYFHGGAYLIGSSAVRNGAYIAATQNIIVVTANYRLGVFGFWFHSTFDSSHSLTGPVDSGNQGLYDQQMAMEWTREHIAKFGGNPNALTIGGMSAGGQSVQAHSVMASSAPLYDRMISLSGPTGVPYKSAEEASVFYEDLAGSLGCCGKRNKPNEFGCEAGVTRPKIPDDFRECLLNKTTTEVQRAAWRLRQLTMHWTKLTSLVEPYCPTYGSWALDEEPFYGFASGAYHDKPMIVETANNEGWNFVLVLKLLDPRGDLDVSPVRWEKLMNTLWGADDADKVLKVYACPCMDEDDIKCDCRQTADLFLTDYTWYCNARYAFSKGLDVTERSMPLYMTLNKGTRPESMNNTKSTHGIGEFLFFGSWRDDMDEREAEWAREYQNYVANFIRTGNPNDWTDNPNPRPAEEFVWVDFQHNREWSQMGHLTFDRYDATSDIRFDRCAMLDEMGQYMKH